MIFTTKNNPAFTNTISESVGVDVSIPERKSDNKTYTSSREPAPSDDVAAQIEAVNNPVTGQVEGLCD